MLIIRRAQPTIFNGIADFTFYPCATFSNTPPRAFIFSVRTTELYRFQCSRVADVAKNNFSYAHSRFLK